MLYDWSSLQRKKRMPDRLQLNIQTDEACKINFHIACIEGWVFDLASLKSIGEGDIDLRNKIRTFTESD